MELMPNQLTGEERTFIVECLENLPMSGKAAGLRKVIGLIDSITVKLADTAGDEIALERHPFDVFPQRVDK